MSSIKVSQTDFSQYQVGDIETGSFVVGFDLNNGGKLTKMDSSLNTTILESVSASGLNVSETTITADSGSFPVASVGDLFKVVGGPWSIGNGVIQGFNGDLLLCIVDSPTILGPEGISNFTIIRNASSDASPIIPALDADLQNPQYVDTRKFTNPAQVVDAITKRTSVSYYGVTSAVVGGNYYKYTATLDNYSNAPIPGQIYTIIPDVTYGGYQTGGFNTSNGIMLNSYVVTRDAAGSVQCQAGDFTAGIPAILYFTGASFVVFTSPFSEYVTKTFVPDGFQDYRIGSDIGNTSTRRYLDWKTNGDFKIFAGRMGIEMHSIADPDNGGVYINTYNDKAGLDAYGYTSLLYSQSYDVTLGFDQNGNFIAQGLPIYANASLASGLGTDNLFVTPAGEVKLSISNYVTSVDITSLTGVDCTNAKVEVNLTSTNATETISSLDYFTTGMTIKFFPASGLTVTFTPGAFKTAGGVNAVIDGTNGDWIQFTERNGVIYQTGGETY